MFSVVVFCLFVHLFICFVGCLCFNLFRFRLLFFFVLPPTNQNARWARHEGPGDRQPGVVARGHGRGKQRLVGGFAASGAGAEERAHCHRMPPAVPGEVAEGMLGLKPDAIRRWLAGAVWCPWTEARLRAEGEAGKSTGRVGVYQSPAVFRSEALSPHYCVNAREPTMVVRTKNGCENQKRLRGRLGTVKSKR